MIVIAGHQHHAAPGQRAAELLEQRAADLERLRQRQLAQLDDVPEQHDPAGVGDSLDERLPLLRLAHDVSPGQAAEMEVRDDGRPHRPDGGMRTLDST